MLEELSIRERAIRQDTDENVCKAVKESVTGNEGIVDKLPPYKAYTVVKPEPYTSPSPPPVRYAEQE